MPDGYRSLGIAALAAALFIAFGLGSYWTGLPYPQERYQSYQDGKTDEDGTLATVTNFTAPVVKRTPCYNPQSKTESDLCAQWRAAKAAEKSANWTVYGFWATLAGMALLTWQIMLTREAVKDTGAHSSAWFTVCPEVTCDTHAPMFYWDHTQIRDDEDVLEIQSYGYIRVT